MTKSRQKFWAFFGLTMSLFFGLFFANNFAKAATYFSDNFDVSIYTVLTSKTPVVGTSWTQLINNGRTFVIYNSGADDYVQVDSNGDNSGTLYQANGTYPAADYEVTCVDTFSGGDSNYTMSLAARIQDANNMYLLRFSNAVFKIYKRVSGTWSLIGSETSSYPQGNASSPPYHGDTVGLRVLGNQIMGTINNNVVLTVTDGDISLAGKAGFGIGYVNISTDDSGTGVNIDTFSVASITTNYTLTYTAGAHGSISGSSPQTVASGNSGSAVIAVPDSGFQFLNWSDGLTTSTRTDTNIVANISVTANFQAVVEGISSNPPPPPVGSGSNNMAFSSGSAGFIGQIESAGTNLVIQPGSQITFSMATANESYAERHELLVSGIDFQKSTADVIIFSAPIKFTLALHEKKLVDLNADGANDVEVALSNLTPSWTEVTVKKISQADVVAPAITPTITPTPATQAPASPTPATPAPQAKYNFSKDLYSGIESADVLALQKFLNNNGFKIADSGSGSPGKEINFFGPLTKSALIKFQKTNKISPCYGFFGSLTRKFINSLP